MSDSSPPADRTAARLAVLGELTGIGMAVARAVGRLAEAVAETAEDAKERPAARASELSLAFSRVSRAVRLTLALEERMEGAAAAAPAPANPYAQSGRLVSALYKADQLGEAARDLIEHAAGEDEAKAERLGEALSERLDELDADEVLERPLIELIARICKDLDIEPDWSLWGDQDWVEDAGGVRAAKRAWAAVAAEDEEAHPA